MLNGVLLYDGLDATGRDAAAHEEQDMCQGHPQDQSQYHYHEVPSCLRDNAKGPSTVVGYAYDGYPIVVERDAAGNLPNNADLDALPRPHVADPRRRRQGRHDLPLRRDARVPVHGRLPARPRARSRKAAVEPVGSIEEHATLKLTEVTVLDRRHRGRWPGRARQERRRRHRPRLGAPGSKMRATANPETLFAAGYSACFQGAVAAQAKKQDIDTSDSTVTATVSFGKADDGGVGIAVAIEVHVPDVDLAKVQELADLAHDETCPYSKATRGNIEVTITAV